MAGLLEGRVAVVTGGGRGLGRAIAARFAEAGASVWIVDLPGALAGAAPGMAGAVGADLATPEGDAALAALADRVGTVDVVAAVAGVVPPWRGIAALDRAEWERVSALNVWGVAATLKAFAGALARSGRGSAILMSSINGYRGHPGQALYVATKHAVIGLARAAALDLGPGGVRVNALAPGPVATGALTARVAARHAAGGPPPAEALAAMAAQTALGRLATERDVADAALWLASDLSGAVTGQTVPVEAGLA